MSTIENTVPRLLASLFSVDGNTPTTGAVIINNNPGCDATIETLNIALRDGHCKTGALGADVELTRKVTDYMIDDIIKVAESLKASWDDIDEIDEDEVDGPSCSDNYVWRVIAGHAYLVFDMNGLCGIRADYLVSELRY